MKWTIRLTKLLAQCNFMVKVKSKVKLEDKGQTCKEILIITKSQGRV